MIDVSTLTANELVSKLQSGEISSVELCNNFLILSKYLLQSSTDEISPD